MTGVFAAVKYILKNIHHVLSSIINFIIIIPMYFIGAGLSRLLYRKKNGAKEAKKSGSRAGSYWKESEIDYGKDSFRRMF